MTRLDIEGIKKPVADLYPVVEDLRCIEIMIPDHDGYLWILAGFVSILGQSWSWQGSLGDRLARAQLWQKAYSETDWLQCMKCEDLIECITPLFEAQTQQIIEQITNLNNYGDRFPGQPMPPEMLEQDLAEGTNPECDLDILWAQSLALVQYTNRAIEDVFEQIESASNAVELTQVFESLPLVRYVTNFIGVDFANDLVNYLQEAVQEGYSAQYTELVEQELACAVFCAARSGCSISVSLLYDIFYGRVTELVPDDPADAIELLAMLAGISVGGTTVVDLMFWFVWGTAKLMEFIMNQSVGTLFTLQQLLNLAVNDANNDWEILCECPETPNISLINTYPGVIENNPTFLSNTESGGSIWECTYFNLGSEWAVSVSPQVGGSDVYCNLIEASPVDEYQHFDGSVYVDGMGDGASPPPWLDLGFYKTTGGVCTIEIEPA